MFSLALSAVTRDNCAEITINLRCAVYSAAFKASMWARDRGNLDNKLAISRDITVTMARGRRINDYKSAYSAIMRTRVSQLGYCPVLGEKIRRHAATRKSPRPRTPVPALPPFRRVFPLKPRIVRQNLYNAPRLTPNPVGRPLCHHTNFL